MSALFDLSGLTLRVRGLPDEQRRRLEERWSGFRVLETRDPFLDVEVEAHAEAEDDDHPFVPKEMTSTFLGTTATYRMKEGSAEVPLEGIVRIRLHATTLQKQYWAFVNLVTAAMAWRLPTNGGALVHAAGIVLDDRAFALVGPEGSGKSTWWEVARRAGAQVLSDDILVVARGPGGRIEALATPFRSKTPGPGRWPLAALLLPEHGPHPSLDEVSILARRARLGANLPFFAEAWTVDPRVERLVETLASSIPFYRLTFAINPSFLEVLRGI